MLLGINQNTTGTSAILFDRSLERVGSGHAHLTRLTPRSGYVEIDPFELLENVMTAVERALSTTDTNPEEIEVVGLANQGETSLCWNSDGEPFYNAIVWQDRRTADRCDELYQDKYFRQYIKETTGLTIDPYFSATKFEWLLNHVEADPEDVYCGTTDTWLLWQLLEHEPFVTDHATASRTMLFNLQTLSWDDQLRAEFGLETVELPRPVSNDTVVGHTDPDRLAGIEAPVAGCITNQQAALYGQGCTSPGEAKCTYRTGSFILMNIGKIPAWYIKGVLGTIAWTVDGETTYALDGGIYTTGAFIDWLVDAIEIIPNRGTAESLAKSVSTTNGVFVVPALSGLASPYWDSDVRGAFVGLDSSISKAHLVRAVLESIAHRVREVVDAMTEETAIELDKLRVDGDITNNDFLLEYQADLLDYPLVVSAISEATALGTVKLAAEAVGLDFATDRIGASERTVTPSGSDGLDRKHEQWRLVVETMRELSNKLTNDDEESFGPEVTKDDYHEKSLQRSGEDDGGE